MAEDPTKITKASQILVNGKKPKKLLKKVKLMDKGRRLEEAVREAQRKK